MQRLKYLAGKERFVRRQNWHIAKALVAFDKGFHQVGETLLQVVMAFPWVWVAISKIPRDTERKMPFAYKTGNTSHMSPHSFFHQISKRSFCGKDVLVIFDSKIQTGKAVWIVVRYITTDLKIECLIHLQLLDQGILSVSNSKSINPTYNVWLSCCKQCGFVYLGSGVSITRVFLPHAFDLVGRKFCTPNLVKFTDQPKRTKRQNYHRLLPNM